MHTCASFYQLITRAFVNLVHDSHYFVECLNSTKLYKNRILIMKNLVINHKMW